MAVLLLGNGINRNEGLVCSWEELFTSTFENDNKKCDTTDSQIDESDSRADLFPSIEGLTMTLGFDLKEFYAIDHAIAENSTDLKRKIADSMRQQMEKKISEIGFKWEKAVHWDLMNLPISTYLTTNYDYALETAFNPSFKSCRGSNETIYSRYRRHTVNVGSESKTVYHIHGELHAPKSICLGFEQYSGTLEKIRSDLVKSTKKSEDPADEHTYHLRDVMMGIKKEDGNDEDDGSWYLKFFKEDIYILGLSLDFSEQDIWWLLDYRIRKKHYEKNDLDICNKVYFFDTDTPDRLSEKEYKARNELLRAFGVEIVYLSGDSYDVKYRNAVRIIEDSIRA